MVFTTIDTSLTPIASVGYQNIRNILDNGGFEIWQRGTSFSNPASGAYTSDRWQVGKSVGITVNVTKDVSIFDTGTASIKVDTTIASGAQMYVNQNIENYESFKGKAITYSCRVKTSTANKIRLAMADGVTQTFSSYHSGSGNFETLSMTYTPSNSATVLTCYVGMVADTVTVNTFWADSAMLVLGSTAVPFVPAHPEVDLSRCQRYYETGTFFDTKAIQRDSTGGGRNRTRANIQFSVTKAVVPTVTTTLGGVTLCHLPTTGNTELADTVNWTITGGATVDKITATAQRTIDQTTFELAELSFTWTAAADV